jgi:hypothetical protein
MIPNKIVIGGHEVTIRIVDDADLLQQNNSSSNWGMACYESNIIAIKKQPSESVMEESLAHEIKHYLDANSGRKSYLQSIEGVDYELQNVMTDNVFWQFLKNNTNFFS